MVGGIVAHQSTQPEIPQLFGPQRRMVEVHAEPAGSREAQTLQHRGDHPAGDAEPSVPLAEVMDERGNDQLRVGVAFPHVPGGVEAVTLVGDTLLQVGVQKLTVVDQLTEFVEFVRGK